MKNRIFTSAELVARARALFSEGPWLRRALQINRPWICPFGMLIESVPENASVLDVGCGSGLFLGLLASIGRISRGLGFDVSRGSIELANRMKARHPLGDILEFTCLDSVDSWRHGHYDVVSVIDLLHHIPPPDQRALVEKATAHVRPGGILLYKDMSVSPAPLAWASVVHDLVFARQWIHIPSYLHVRSWATEAGLTEESHARVVILWYGHEMGVFRRPKVS